MAYTQLELEDRPHESPEQLAARTANTARTVAALTLTDLGSRIAFRGPDGDHWPRLRRLMRVLRSCHPGSALNVHSQASELLRALQNETRRQKERRLKQTGARRKREERRLKLQQEKEKRLRREGEREEMRLELQQGMCLGVWCLGCKRNPFKRACPHKMCGCCCPGCHKHKKKGKKR